MPQSISHVYVHLIFSTKYRQPLIDDSIKEELYSYMGGICKHYECYPVQIGGYYDHIHILCTLSPKIPLMKLMEYVKKNSSKWIKTKGSAYAGFYWQTGYAAFSVSIYKVETVKRYIQNQYRHHQKKNFQDECRGIYKNYKIPYDEKYVWD